MTIRLLPWRRKPTFTVAWDAFSDPKWTGHTDSHGAYLVLGRLVFILHWWADPEGLL